jgi:hypothetical protein
MTRRPEDMGLEADPAHLKDQRPSSSDASGINPATPHASAVPGINEVNYTVQQALRTRSFWLLAAFSAAGYMVHSGMTLHQVAHFINQGLTGPAAALTASVFAVSQVLGGVLWSTLVRRMPLRLLLSLSGFTMAVGAIGIGASASQYGGVPSATALGVGGGRPAFAGPAYLGRLLRPAAPGQHPEADLADTDCRAGPWPHHRRVYVRCYRRISTAFFGLRHRRFPGWTAGAGRYTAHSYPAARGDISVGPQLATA